MNWTVPFDRPVSTGCRDASDGLLQELGHIVRVKTQEVQGHQLQVPEHHVGAPAY